LVARQRVEALDIDRRWNQDDFAWIGAVIAEQLVALAWALGDQAIDIANDRQLGSDAPGWAGVV
jgi:hypothetical protein